MLVFAIVACFAPASSPEPSPQPTDATPGAPGEDHDKTPISPEDRNPPGSDAPSLSPAEPGSEPDPVTLGLCDGWDTARLDLRSLEAVTPTVADAAALGLTIVRPHRARGHVFSWNLIYPPDAPVAQWSLADAVVAEAGTLNVALLITLYPTADPGPGGGGVVGVGPPSDTEAYQTFVSELVERYDGDGVGDMAGLAIPVRHWEIGNEPTCATEDVPCQIGFVQLVRLTAAAIRVADPDAFVIAGASAPLHVQGGSRNTRAEAVYRYFVDNGGLENTDALNIHLATGMSEVSIDESLDLWHEIAGDQPIWITEMATRSPHDRDRVAPTEAGEATWLTDTLDRAAARNVDHVFWCLAKGDMARFPAVTEAIRDYTAR